jgi:predicted MPP superfamily phosphohydrolase
LLAAQKPQVVAITGDILDFDSQLQWLPNVLEPLAAVPLRLFVLGNHDLRLSDTDQLRRIMVELGWIDLGRTGTLLSEEPVPIAWWGDERPWYPPAEALGSDSGMVEDQPPREALPAGRLRVGLAHTPDRFPWARRQRLDLLLAGHTHGGQIRLPGIGPLVAPSWYGSRWASGVFHWAPTVMHVSRGLSGVHPVRLRCSPEVSLLRLEASG